MARKSLARIDLFDTNATMSARARSAGAFLAGIPEDMSGLLNDSFEMASSLFRLPALTKAQFDAKVNGTLAGWTLASRTGPSTASRPREYESFDVLLERSDKEEAGVVPSYFEPTNQWPPGQLRSVSQQLAASVFRPLQDRIWSILEGAGGLAPGYFASLDQNAGLASIRYLHYPPSATSLGFYDHTDFETFAIVHESRPGMEVWDQETQSWRRVSLGSDEILVLVGELAVDLSGGCLRSSLHRVTVSPSRSPRFATVYFSAPAFFAAMPQHADLSGSPAAHASVTVGELLMRRFGQSFDS